MDDKIDVAPVDPEIERRRRDDGAQTVFGHRRLHPATLGDVERTVVQGDRQIIVVDRPELLEQHLRLAARVDEEQRRTVLFDGDIDVGDRITCRMAGPGHVFLRPKDGDFGFCSTGNGDQPRTRLLRGGLLWGGLLRGRLRDQPSLQVQRIGDRRRKADRLQCGGEPAQTREAERQEMTALRHHQRVQLVQDHITQILEEALRLAIGEKQRQLLRGRQQNVGRIELLTLSLALGRVAGAVFLSGPAAPSHRPAS